jgi:glucans biosynthesis protein C
VVAHHATIALDFALVSAGLEPSIVRELAGNQSGLLQAIRMPLFTFLSGWVYALRPFASGSRIEFLTGKVRRIIIPLFAVATLKCFFSYAMFGEEPVPPSEFWTLWFVRFGHLWFLHALVVLFAVIALIDHLGWMRSARQWLLWLGIAAVLPYVIPGTQVWSLNKVPELLVFFLAGVGASRFSHLWTGRRVMGCAWLAFALSMAVHVWWKLGGEVFDPWPHYLVTGAVGPICLLSLNMCWQPLVWIGGYSYSIYLFHGFGLDLFAVILHLPAAVPTRAAWFIGLVAAGLCLPILIDHLAARVPYLRTLLLGRRPTG